jgi:hypothetical protein
VYFHDYDVIAARAKYAYARGTKMIADIQTEQEQKNAALAARATDPTRLGAAPRYAKGIAHPSGPEE